MKKKRKLGRKLLSFLLTLAMVVGLLPGMGLLAYADGAPPYAGLKNTTTVVTFDGKPWYLIDYDDTTVTLLSKECVGASAFGTNQEYLEYSGSTVETAVNSYYTDSISTDAKTAVNGGMFLLTNDQANTIEKANPDVLKCSQATGAQYNYWWHSSRREVAQSVLCVAGESGSVYGEGANVTLKLGVRPALQLDLSKLTFDSTTKTFSLKSAVTEYPLWVGGVQVTDENRDDLANSHWSYTPATTGDNPTPATLTLNGYSCDGVGYRDAAIYAEGDLVIDVRGDSSVTGPAPSGFGFVWQTYGVMLGTGTLTVRGPGTLTARGGDYSGQETATSCGVLADNIVVEQGASLVAEGGKSTMKSQGAYARNTVSVQGTLAATGGTAPSESVGLGSCETITVAEGGTLTATGGASDDSYGVYTYGSVNVGAGARMTAAGGKAAVYGTVKNAIAGTGWTDTAGTENETDIAVNADQGQTMDYKRVQFPAAYPLWVGGVRVTDENRDDLANSHWSYTPATTGDNPTPATLTLNGYSCDGVGYRDAAIYAEGDLVIDVRGDSSVTGPAPSGFGFVWQTYGVMLGTGTLTVRGPGTLTARGGDYSGQETATSCGVLADNIVVEQGASLVAEGGKSTMKSQGAYARNTVSVQGTLAATGGTAPSESVGLGSCETITVAEGGTLTATGGASDDSYGVYTYGSVNVGAGARMTAAGGKAAVYGTVKNAIAGTGWTDTAGTENETDIAVNADPGQTMDYKRVQFPAAYPLWVGGVRATDENRDDLANSHWSYTPATTGDNPTPATLTLNGYSCDGVGYKDAAIYAEGDLVIDVRDDSSVTGPAPSGFGFVWQTYGVMLGTGTLTVRGPGTLTARGGDYSGQETATSCGVLADNIVVEQGASLVAEGGKSTMKSQGAYARNTVSVQGTLAATGGTAPSESVGLGSCETITVAEGGTLTATGGASDDSYGVYTYGSVNVGAGARMTAAGGKAAVYGTVKNAIAGTGWTDTEGTTGKAAITVSEAGQTLNSYKKIQFPAVHDHSFTYTSTGDMITATCSKEGCTLPKVGEKHIATLTIVKPTMTTYGQIGEGISEVATITDENSIKGDAEVKYYNATKSGETYTKTGDALTAAPTNAGNYVAEITLGEDTNEATASVGYTIAPKPVTVSGITAENKTYDGTTDATLDYTYASISGKLEDDNLTVTATGAFEDANVGDKTVNLSDLTLGGTDKDNYVLAATGQQATATAGINPKSISGATVTLDKTQLTYNGSEQTVNVTDVTIDGMSLTENTDYIVNGNTGIDKSDYTVTVTGLGNFSNIATANWKIVEKAMTVKADNVTVTYDGKEHGIKVDVIDPASGAEVSYGTTEGTYDLGECPTIKDAGTLTIYYKVTAGSNYSVYTGKAVVTVEKHASTAASVTANDREYDGTEKPLVNVTGEATGGEMQYAIGTDATTAPTTGYTTSIPTATDAGTYYVWYKAVGDEDHSDSKPACITVTISKPAEAPAPADEEKGEADFKPNAAAPDVKGVEQEAIKSQMEELAKADDTKLKAGQVKDVTVNMETKAVAESDVPKKEASAIKETAEGMIPAKDRESTKCDFLDIAVSKIVIVYDVKNGQKVKNESNSTKLTNLAQVIDIPVKYDLTGKFNPLIVRYHNGKAEAFRRLYAAPAKDALKDGTYYVEGTGKNAIVHIYTNRFSTYALLTSGTEEYPKPGDSVTVYRLYYGPTMEHFYTTSAYERRVLIDKYGWVDEGIAWKSPKAPTTDEEKKTIKPVYRLFNPFTTDHHYTKDANERKTLIDKYGWKDEGIAFYSNDKGDATVYRLWHPGLITGAHHFTTGKHEYDVLITRGWVGETEAFKVNAAS